MNILTGRIFRLDKNNELLKLYMYPDVLLMSGYYSQGAWRVTEFVNTRER